MFSVFLMSAMDSPSLSPEKKRKSVANLDNQLTLDIRSKALTSY